MTADVGPRTPLREALAQSMTFEHDVTALTGGAARVVHWTIVPDDVVMLLFMGPPEHVDTVRALAPANDHLRFSYCADERTRRWVDDARHAPQESIAPEHAALLDYLLAKALESWTPGT